MAWRREWTVCRPQAARRERKAGKKGVFIGRYIYRLLDTAAILFGMKNHTAQWKTQYDRLRDRFKDLDWISEGYVQNRGPGAGGPCYQWTRKVRGKTLSVALSREQYEWLRQAIINWRQVQQTLKEMQRLSRAVLFATQPHPPRPKRLGKKVLGLI